MANTNDPQRSLELTLEDYEKDPDAPGIKQGLAWAYWIAGNKDEGLKFAEEFLASLGDEARPLSWANMIVVTPGPCPADRQLLCTTTPIVTAPCR